MTPRNLLMSAGLAALLAGAGTAQTTGETGTDTTTGEAPAIGTTETDPGAALVPEFTSLEEMTVGDVLGLKVVGPEGETIGDIDYIIGTETGAAIVIGIGGFLSLGEYTVALPLSEFDYDAEQRVLTLGTDKETLKAQPEIDESGLESLPDETPIATLMESDAETDSGAAGDDADMTDQDAAEEDATEEGAADVGAASEGVEGDAAEEDSMTDGAATDADSATGDGAVSDEATTDEGSASGDASATEDEAAGDAGATEEGAVDSETADEGATEELEEETENSGG